MNFGQAAHIQHRRLLEPTLPTLNDVMLHGKTKTKKSMRDESKQCVRFQYMIACVLFEYVHMRSVKYTYTYMNVFGVDIGFRGMQAP